MLLGENKNNRIRSCSGVVTFVFGADVSSYTYYVVHISCVVSIV